MPEREVPGTRASDLGDPDRQGLPPAHHGGESAVAIGETQQQTEADRGCGDYADAAQIVGDPIFQQKPGNHHGHCRHSNLQQFIQARVDAGQRGSGASSAAYQAQSAVQIAAEFDPEVTDHRDQGAEVHGDVEGQALVRPAPDLGRQYQMGRAGNGQKFGESLYECEHDDLQPIHRGSLSGGQGRRQYARSFG